MLLLVSENLFCQLINISEFLHLHPTVSATPSTRHRYQENALRILTKEQMRGGRIVGGSDADIANYPYQIALFFGQGHTCGGSILNTNTVISAAHCTQ